MKKLSTYILAFLTLALTASCYEGIDPITQVDPGPDTEIPTAEIISPNGNVIIPFTDNEANLSIEIAAQDDIEISNVTIMVDGSMFKSINSFLDYRIFNEIFVFENMQLGPHTIELIVTDTVGNSATDSITFILDNTYTPILNSETFYMPFFEGLYTELISETDPTIIGSPEIISEGYSGQAYKGTTDAYLTFPTQGLFEDDNGFTNQFSTTFWYKVSGEPTRSGILVVGDDATDRNQGFRIFREGNATEQRIKANIGVGTGDSWNDGGVIDVAAGAWVHVAVTVSETESKMYFNGELVNSNTLSSPIDWTNCDNLTIGAGGPTFSYWNHLSDSSPMDELRLYNVALTQEQIQDML